MEAGRRGGRKSQNIADMQGPFDEAPISQGRSKDQSPHLNPKPESPEQTEDLHMHRAYEGTGQAVDHRQGQGIM